MPAHICVIFAPAKQTVKVCVYAHEIRENRGQIKIKANGTRTKRAHLPIKMTSYTKQMENTTLNNVLYYDDVHVHVT